MARRILILGGTTEARELATHLAHRPDLSVTVSLAGRTAAIAPHDVPLRVGGFGGPAGLADYLRAEPVDVLIDATHPYAAIISRNAAEAARAAGVPLLALRRPPWVATEGDRWLEVADAGDAATMLGSAPRRVFLALGRNDLEPFVQAPQHFYLVRSVDPITPPLPLPHVDYIVERGPFTEAGDRALMEHHRIDRLVCRNSGGGAAYAKIAAARALATPVILLRRPSLPDVPAVDTVDEAVAWLDHALTA